MFEDLIGDRKTEAEQEAVNILYQKIAGCPDCGNVNIEIYPRTIVNILLCYCYCSQCGNRWTFNV